MHSPFITSTSLADLLKNLPQHGSSLCRCLSLIHLLYSKYKPLKDEITNKQIQFLIANDGILDKDLEPNPEVYLREYKMIKKQVENGLALTQETIISIDQGLNTIEQILQTLKSQDDNDENEDQQDGDSSKCSEQSETEGKEDENQQGQQKSIEKQQKKFNILKMKNL